MKHRLRFFKVLLASLIAVAASSVYAKTSAESILPSRLVGAFPSPPWGAGPGKLTMLRLPGYAVSVVKFGKAGTTMGNSFYVAVDSSKNQIYVPSVAGTTHVISLATGKRLRHFKSIPGGRVARISPDHKTLFILSGKELAAYSISDDAMRYRVPVGGNAMAFNADGSQLYVGGNMDKTITDINTSGGLIQRHIHIGHSGDMVWANGKLFSADMRSGVMSVYNPQTRYIHRLKTGEVDPQFSYKQIPAAKAGLMQLSVSSNQKTVYAAGFSGHILKFATAKPAYLGEVKISVGKAGSDKLSGLATLANTDEAIITIENHHESVIVDLRSGRVIRTLPNVTSNRWVLVR